MACIRGEREMWCALIRWLQLHNDTDVRLLYPFDDRTMRISQGSMVARFKVSLEKAVEIHGGERFDLTSLPPTPNIDRWWAALQMRPGFYRGCVVPERMHAELPVDPKELPPWYVAYNKRYGLS